MNEAKGLFVGTIVSPLFGWGYTHDGRADKDSYPHDRNVTYCLCSLIKLCFAFIMVNFRLNVLLLFMLKIIYFKRCLNH